MKHKINKVDFKTWNSWNMPYYTETVRRLPDNNLEEHLDKEVKTKNAFLFVILGLLTVLVVIKWDQIIEFFNKNGEGTEPLVQGDVEELPK